MNGKVSVIVPTYNRPDKLEKALQAVKQQTYEKIEVVVVNDGSDVSYSEVAALDDPRVDYHEHTENQGACAARNTGIKRSDGDFVAFLDDDDQWTSDKIENQVNALQKTDGDTKVCYSGVVHKDGNGHTRSVKEPNSRGWVKQEILLSNFVETFSNVMVKREAISETGLLDVEFPAWQDWEWYIRLAQDHKYTYVDSIGTVHVEYDGDRMSSDLSRVEEALFKMLGKHTETASEYGKRSEFQSNCYSTIGRYGLATGNYSIAMRYAVQSLIYNPYNQSGAAIVATSLNNGSGYRIFQKLRRVYNRYVE